MNSFLEDILNDLDQQGIQTTQVTYIVPSRRVAIFLSKGIASRISTPVFEPEILSIEQFIEKLSGLKISADIDLLGLFYKAYKKVQPADELERYDDFLGWAPTILKDFNELDRYLVPTDDFFTFLGNVRELEDWHWSLGKDQTPMVSNYLKFWKRLHLYYAAFKEMCLQDGRVYQGLAYRSAFAKAETSHQLFKKPLVFLGLNALNTAESNIVQYFLDQGKATIYWDTDRYFMDRPFHEAGKFIRSYQKEWKYYQENPLKFIHKQFATPKYLEMASASGPIATVQVAVKKLLEIPAHQLPETVIVLADEALLIPLLNAIPESVDSYNVTMGLGLEKLPISGFILDLISLHIEHNDKGFYFKNLIKVLESRFATFLTSANPYQIIKNIRDRNLVHIHKGDLVEANQPNEFLELILSKNNEVEDLMRLIHTILDQLKESLIVEGNKHLELEQLLAMTQVMHGLHELLHAGEKIEDLRTLLFLLRQLLPLKKLDFIGEPVHGLQIMGLLETRGLDYKNVIMLSVNEGVLPAGKTVASYIPHDMKRKFNLPTYSEKDSVYAYHFYRLLHRVNSACFVYSTNQSSLGGGEKSRFLTQLASNDQVSHEITSHDFIYKNTPVAKELITVEKTESYFARLQDIANKGFSPSALTAYVRNPLDFYAQKILRVPQVEEVEESMALNTMGSIIHEALDQLYRPHVNKIMVLDDFKEMKSRIKKEVDTAFNLYYPSRTQPLGRNKIIYEVATHYVNMMLAQDLQLVKEDNELIIKSVERELKATVDIDGIGTVHLHGKVDRIDQLNGITRIIDYKTGAVDKGEVGIEPGGYGILSQEYKKSKAFQVLMYALLYAQSESSFSEVTAGIISFKKFNQGFVPFAIKSGRSYKPAMIDTEVLEHFKVELMGLIQELFDPNEPIIEKEV
jgi:hypothetical protein